MPSLFISFSVHLSSSSFLLPFTPPPANNKTGNNQASLEPPQLVGVRPEEIGPCRRGKQMGQRCLLRAPVLLPQEDRRPQSVMKQARFSRQPCVFWFPSSPLVIGLCVLACLMHYPTIWNALIFQTIDFRLAENMVAWKEDCISNLLLLLCTSCPAWTSCHAGQQWPPGGRGMSFSPPTHSLILKIRLSKDSHSCFLASGLQECVLALSSACTV